MTANSAIKLLRLNDVISQVGMKRSWIFQQVKDGNFPKPIKLGAHAIAWRESDIVDWVNTREIADSYK